MPKNPGVPKKIIPKNPGIAQKGTQKSGSNPQKVPKIMAHPRITTYVITKKRSHTQLDF